MGLREACAELHLTQSAISKRLKSLQLDLGVELYKRNQQGIELTDAGRAALSKIELIVKQADDLKQSFRRTIPQKKPPVIVSVASAFSLTRQLLPRLFAGFEKSHAGVQVKCQTGRRTNKSSRWFARGGQRLA